VEIDLPNLLRISLLGGAAFPIAPSGSARLLPDYWIQSQYDDNSCRI